MNPRRRQRNGVRNRRPCVQNAGVIGHGLLVSPARRRLFTTAAKIADTFFLANAVMNDTMTQQDTDDTEKPPPCPWCHASGVKEMTGSDGSSDARWFHCQSCERMFSIHFERLKPPAKN
jgi:hypothetical protein